MHHGSAPPSLREPVGEAARDVRVHLPALAGGAVGRGEDAAGEAIALERLFADERGPVVVAVGQVPLAEPARAVAVLAQHRPPGGKAGVEGASARDHAARLMRVQAGQQRRARGRAVVRGGVVPGEGHGALAQALEVGGQAQAGRVGREPLREAQLVDDDHEDVRFAPSARAASARPVGLAARARRACAAVGVGRGADREPRAREGPPAISPPFRNVRRSTLLCCAASMLSMRALILGPAVVAGLGLVAPAAVAGADGPGVRSGDARQLGAAGRLGDRLAAGRQPRRLAADADQLPRRARAASSARSASSARGRALTAGAWPRTRRATARASCRRDRSPKASA